MRWTLFSIFAFGSFPRPYYFKNYYKVSMIGIWTLTFHPQLQQIYETKVISDKFQLQCDEKLKFYHHKLSHRVYFPNPCLYKNYYFFRQVALSRNDNVFGCETSCRNPIGSHSAILRNRIFMLAFIDSCLPSSL